MIKIILSYFILLSISNLISTSLVFILYFILRIFLNYNMTDFVNFFNIQNSYKLYSFLILTEVISLTFTILFALWGYARFRIPYANIVIATIPIVILVPFIFKVKKLREIIKEKLFDETVNDDAIYK